MKRKPSPLSWLLVPLLLLALVGTSTGCIYQTPTIEEATIELPADAAVPTPRPWPTGPSSSLVPRSPLSPWTSGPQPRDLRRRPGLGQHRARRRWHRQPHRQRHRSTVSRRQRSPRAASQGPKPRDRADRPASRYSVHWVHSVYSVRRYQGEPRRLRRWVTPPQPTIPQDRAQL